MNLSIIMNLVAIILGALALWRPSSHLISAASTCESDLGQHNHMSPSNRSVVEQTRVVFNCTLDPNDIEQYHPMEVAFTVNGSPIHSSQVQILNEYTAQLIIENATSHDDGRYTCHVNGECLGSAALRVGPRPEPVHDLACVFLFRDELRCEWTNPATNVLPTVYELKKLPDGAIELAYGCGLNWTEGNRSICIWNQKTKERAARREHYFFTLTARNEFGHYEMFYDPNLEDIVRSHPVINLTFIPETGNLSWSLNRTLGQLDIDPSLKNLIEYEIVAKALEDLPEHEDEASVAHYIDATSILIGDYLHPFTKYNISVSVHVNSSRNEHWSEPQSIIVQTKVDVPASPPELVNTAFEITNHTPLSRSATLYWRKLPDRLCNSPTISYYIEYFDSILRNVTITSTQHTFHELSSHPIEFRLFSLNSVGRSVNHSSLHLPSSDHVLTPPSHLVVTQQDDEYRLKWQSSEKLSYYNVFWCLRAKSDTCVEGDFNWHSTNDTTDLILTLNTTDVYRFGISSYATSAVLPVASGIAWTNCIVNVDGKLSHLPHYKFENSGPSSIVIKWGFLCEAQKALVQELSFRYCTGSCRPESTQVATLKNAQNETEYELRDLTPKTTYNITIYSPNIEKEERVMITTDSPPPSPPLDVTVVRLNQSALSLAWNFSPRDTVGHFTVRIAGQLEQMIQVPSPEYCDRTTQHCALNVTFPLEKLRPFTEYSVLIIACGVNNIASCSSPASGNFRTAVSRPGRMELPRVEELANGQYRISIEPPHESNGPIDHYYLRQNIDEQPKRISVDAHERYVDIEASCKSSVANTFQISLYAVNIDEQGRELVGEPSDWYAIRKCTNPFNYIVPIALILLVILVIFGLFLLVKHARRMVKKTKEISIKVECNNLKSESEQLVFTTQGDDDVHDNDRHSPALARNAETITSLGSSSSSSTTAINSEGTASSSVASNDVYYDNNHNNSSSSTIGNHHVPEYRAENREYFILSSLNPDPNDDNSPNSGRSNPHADDESAKLLSGSKPAASLTSSPPPTGSSYTQLSPTNGSFPFNGGPSSGPDLRSFPSSNSRNGVYVQNSFSPLSSSPSSPPSSSSSSGLIANNNDNSKPPNSFPSASSTPSHYVPHTQFEIRKWS